MKGICLGINQTEHSKIQMGVLGAKSPPPTKKKTLENLYVRANENNCNFINFSFFSIVLLSPLLILPKNFGGGAKPPNPNLPWRMPLVYSLSIYLLPLFCVCFQRYACFRLKNMILFSSHFPIFFAPFNFKFRIPLGLLHF